MFSDCQLSPQFSGISGVTRCPPSQRSAAGNVYGLIAAPGTAAWPITDWIWTATHRQRGCEPRCTPEPAKPNRPIRPDGFAMEPLCCPGQLLVGCRPHASATVSSALRFAVIHGRCHDGQHHPISPGGVQTTLQVPLHPWWPAAKRPSPQRSALSATAGFSTQQREGRDSNPRCP